jgi:DNA-binding PadR family transcriptional regulator
MALDHILLGLLREPSTGYDLKKLFDGSLGHFWAAEQSQIYTTLAKLEKDKSLRSRRAPSLRGPQRRVYSLTTKGRRELRDWLRQGPEVGDQRFHYLAQVFFLDELENTDKAIDFLVRLREHFALRLEALDRVDAELVEEIPGYPDTVPPDLFFPVLTLSLGRKRIQATLDWIEESLARVRTLGEQATDAGGPPK